MFIELFFIFTVSIASAKTPVTNCGDWKIFHEILLDIFFLKIFFHGICRNRLADRTKNLIGTFLFVIKRGIQWRTHLNDWFHSVFCSFFRPSGKISSTICLDFYSWYSSFSSSPARKYPSSWFISNSVARWVKRSFLNKKFKFSAKREHLNPWKILGELFGVSFDKRTQFTQHCKNS